MKKLKLHYYVFFILFCLLVQVLIPSYSYVISQVELLLLFIFIFLLLNAFLYLKKLINHSLSTYNFELKISIKTEVYFILLYLYSLQLFFKIILNLYYLMFNFFKFFLVIYTRQILILFNLLLTLISYLYLNFLVTIFLEMLNIKTIFINTIKNYNLQFLLVNSKLLAFNRGQSLLF